jgi:curli biogenesis system outer membrane secretion channel CsgG
MTRKFLILATFVLLAALAVLSSLPSAPTQAQNKREIEGATVEDNKITLKPGYEFVKRSNNGVFVRKKGVNTKVPPSGGGLSCACTSVKDDCGGTTCVIRFSDTDAKCSQGSCCSSQCKFELD